MKFISCCLTLIIIYCFVSSVCGSVLKRSYRIANSTKAKEKNPSTSTLRTKGKQDTNSNWNSHGNGNKTDPSEEDASFNRIRGYIHDLAVVSMVKTNIEDKKKLAGALSESYPENLRLAAMKKHYDINKWKSVMSLPNKLYRFCIYPIYELNYSKWCEEKYATKSQQKLVNCKNSFCNVCCDNLQVMFKNQADTNTLGVQFGLANASGFKRIQKAATKQEIRECKQQCNLNYPTQLPKAVLPVPRDPKLGKWADTPAKSCADIKRWGAEDNPSGTYWIDLGKKGRAQVYCDMYSMRGGWTLFFNYVHLPDGELLISEGKLPPNLRKNSHLNLKDSGFSEMDVQELRFFCTEKSSKKYFWHFMTDSPKMISTAFSGDQRKMQLEELKTTYHELQFPGKAMFWNKSMNQFEMQDGLDFVHGNQFGGFWDKPFGSTSMDKFWIVKGSDKSNERYNCGTFHKSASESNTSYTHHTVWFRGEPPSEDFARARYYNKQIKAMETEAQKLARQRDEDQNQAKSNNETSDNDHGVIQD